VNEDLLSVVDQASGRRLSARIVRVGEDLVVAIGGGDAPHVGCVVLAIPYPSKARPQEWSASCSLLTIPPHKEEPIARGIADRLASALGRVTVVTAGVHEEGLDRAGIDCYLRLSERLAEEIVRQLSSMG
jgi:hypothetical protein